MKNTNVFGICSSRELVIIHNFKQLVYTPKERQAIITLRRRRHYSLSLVVSSQTNSVKNTNVFGICSSRELVIIHNFKQLVYTPKERQAFAWRSFGAEEEI